MPTYNRRAFIPTAIACYLSQDYPNSELIILDDGNDPVADLIPQEASIRYLSLSAKLSIGLKRNQACKLATGKIIIHLDDDDWYAADWVTLQVNHLVFSGAEICGLNQLRFYLTETDTFWYYTDGDQASTWVYGATLCYWKSFWALNPFDDVQSGEDIDFIKQDHIRIYAYTREEGYVGVIHGGNFGVVAHQDPKKKIIVRKWMKNVSSFHQVAVVESCYRSKEIEMVTCIMPTANRAKYLPLAINYFLEQYYPRKELIIIDDGKEDVSSIIPMNGNIRYYRYSPAGKLTIGTKRNMACQKAQGSIVVHWDDDDWYAPDWIDQQVRSLSADGVNITGLNQVQFYSVVDQKCWITKNENSKNPWLSGATLAYRLSFWKQHPFKNLQIGEDDDFVRNSHARLYAHNYYQGFIAVIHPKNTTIKVFQDRKT